MDVKEIMLKQSKKKNVKMFKGKSAWKKIPFVNLVGILRVNDRMGSAQIN